MAEPTDYDELYRLLRIAVHRVCPGWLRDRQDDLVQAAMMSIHGLLERRRETEATFSASYLRKVAYTALVDEIRRHRSRREVPLEMEVEQRVPRTPAPSPDDVALGREVGSSVRECLTEMLSARRDAVALYLVGHRVPEIAELLNWSRKRASNLVYRGLDDLRGCLQRKGFAR